MGDISNKFLNIYLASSFFQYYPTINVFGKIISSITQYKTYDSRRLAIIIALKT